MNVHKGRDVSVGTLFAQIFLLIILCFSFCLIAQAQSTAVLNGTVTDPSGAAVPSAKIVVTNQATGEVWNTQTNSDGLYVLPSLPPGIYQVSVTTEGFQKLIVKGLELDVATTVTRDLQLTVGSVTQEVTVTTEAPLIETSTTGVGQVIDPKTVQDIPLNGRHFVDLNCSPLGPLRRPKMDFSPLHCEVRDRSPSTQPVNGKTQPTGWSTALT